MCPATDASGCGRPQRSCQKVFTLRKILFSIKVKMRKEQSEEQVPGTRARYVLLAGLPATGMPAGNMKRTASSAVWIPFSFFSLKWHSFQKKNT